MKTRDECNVRRREGGVKWVGRTGRDEMRATTQLILLPFHPVFQQRKKRPENIIKIMCKNAESQNRKIKCEMKNRNSEIYEGNYGGNNFLYARSTPTILGDLLLCLMISGCCFFGTIPFIAHMVSLFGRHSSIRGTMNS